MIKFVTANYNGMNDTKMCGTQNRADHYKYSLTTLANMKQEIYCYTTESDWQYALPHFVENGVDTLIKPVFFNLQNSIYHKRVMAIKDNDNKYYTTIDWNTRNVEIMWGKFLWMEECMQSLNDDDYIFWIDAGISHGGIIPKKYNPNASYEDNYVEVYGGGKIVKYEKSFNYTNIFNETFVSNLIKFAGEKIFNIVSVNPQHVATTELDDIIPFENVSIIGGIFGGKKKYMTPYINRFKELADITLSRGILYKEEQIMSLLYCENKQAFKTFDFGTWYHDDWEGYVESDEVHLKAFYKLFEEINDVQK